MKPDTLSETTPDQASPAPMPQVGTPMTAAAPAGESDRNLLAAFALTMLFGQTGLHQLYLGNKTQAWVRFGLLVTIIFSFVPIIWGIVDFFLVYLQRKDAEGRALSGTERDKYATKIIFWVYIAAMALYIVALALLFSLGAFAGSRDYNY